MQEYVLKVVIELELSTQEKEKEKEKDKETAEWMWFWAKHTFRGEGERGSDLPSHFCLGLCVARRKKIKRERKLRSLFATMSKRKRKETERERKRTCRSRDRPVFELECFLFGSFFVCPSLYVLLQCLFLCFVLFTVRFGLEVVSLFVLFALVVFVSVYACLRFTPSRCVVILVDIFVRTPASVSCPRPSFLQT